MKDINYITQTYSDMILKIAYNYMGNIHDAEDITQNVLIKLLNVDFSTVINEKAYIIRTTINTCKNLKTSVWFKRVIGFSQTDELSFDDKFFEDDILLPKISTMKDNYKNVLYLHYYEQYTVTEIAEILRVKPQLVSTWLKRAKEKLKTMIGEDFNEKYV